MIRLNSGRIYVEAMRICQLSQIFHNVNKFGHITILRMFCQVVWKILLQKGFAQWHPTILLEVFWQWKDTRGGGVPALSKSIQTISWSRWNQQQHNITAYLLKKSQCIARQFVLFQFCCCLCAECKSKSSLIQCICIPQKVCGLDEKKKKKETALSPFPSFLLCSVHWIFTNFTVHNLAGMSNISSAACQNTEWKAEK